VADFHSPEAAAKAGEDWARQFQKREIPEEVEVVTVDLKGLLATDGSAGEVLESGECRIRLDRLLAQIRLADSVSDAVRKIKQNAVRLNGELQTGPVCLWDTRKENVLRVGKKIKKVVPAD
jgi:tyrosyl-tRNA synthetase